MFEIMSLCMSAVLKLLPPLSDGTINNVCPKFEYISDIVSRVAGIGSQQLQWWQRVTVMKHNMHVQLFETWCTSITKRVTHKSILCLLSMKLAKQ